MSEVQFVINAELREESGKGASRRLRNKGKVPAILYGDGKKPQSLTLEHNEIIKHLENEAFYSHILTLVANGKQQRAIIRDIQRHPFKLKVTHMDFQRVNSRTKLTTNVPLHFMNEDICIGFKASGIISHQMNELEISCLPKDLPEYIEINVANLDVGESIHISDIILPDGVESIALAHGEGHDLPVVSILHRGGSSETDETDETDDIADVSDDTPESNEE